MNGTSKENPTVTNGGSKEERRVDEDLDFTLLDPCLFDEILMNIEGSSHQLLENQIGKDLLITKENLAIELHNKF